MRTFGLLLLAITLSILSPAAGIALEPTVGAVARTTLHLTLYSDGYGLVSEGRAVALGEGGHVLRLTDVARDFALETLLVEAEGLRLRDAHMVDNPLTPEALLREHLGEEVTLVFREERAGATTYRRERGTLLSLDGGQLWQIGDRIVTNPGVDSFDFDRLPAELTVEPLLFCQVEAAQPVDRLELTYQTRGLGWKADYLYLLDAESRGAWTGNVTLHNRTDIAFTDSEVALMAGSMKRMAQSQQRMARKAMAPTAQYAAEADVEKATRAEVFEYHRYALPGRVDLGVGETRRVELMNAPEVSSERLYRLTSRSFWYTSRVNEETHSARVLLKLENKEGAGLGSPLPGGVVHVYGRDPAGRLQFLGEDRIQHTPVDETVELAVGKAFDVTARRVQKSHRVNRAKSSTIHESSFEVTIRNAKKRPVTVEVEERFGGRWRVLSSTHDARDKDAFTAVFPVEVEAEGSATLAFTVQVTY